MNLKKDKIEVKIGAFFFFLLNSTYQINQTKNLFHTRHTTTYFENILQIHSLMIIFFC